MLIILMIPNIALAHSFFDASGRRVLDVKTSTFKNGTDILLYTPYGTENQNFIYDAGQFKLATRQSFCLDVSRNKNYKYNQIILWECNGGQNQKFTIANGFIYPHDNPVQCLTYSTAGALTAADCKRSANQKFVVPKVCLYKDANYKGAATCLKESKALVDYNDTASSVSVVNTVARLYQHASYQGKSRRVDSNISWLGKAEDNMVSSVKIPTERTFLITSDPQLICTKSCGVSTSTSLDNIRQQYTFFAQKYPDVDAVIINGDETEYGHKDEWDKFEEMAGYLKGLPYYFGLGNHDIFNNLNNCYENNCTIRSFLKLKDHVRSKKNVYSFDMLFTAGYVFPTVRETLKGSFSYSLDFGDVLVIQLNDFEKKRNPINIDQYSSLAPAQGGNGAQRFVIERYQDAQYQWLKNQLEQADIKNQVVILNQHRDDADAGKLNELLSKHNVKLRFSGHYHYNVLKTKNGFFTSGSTARGDYLKLKINTQKRVVEVYKYKKGTTAQGQEELMEKINISTKKGPSQLTSAPVRIKVKNSGAYISFVNVRWIDSNGKYHNVSSGDLYAGNVYDYTVPAGGKLSRLESSNYTGLLWEPTKRIFDIYDRKSDICINTWGTTLSPSWDQTSCY
ncbi:ricin-type beta-trefoil lectin domain protein [Vagococcus sp. WN89Y]|uniref:ricin-type beta-trefoil lectin domain protein n=1 Tax=Vagococcus sp. WN89Y TaxID=3457258 RepID=UPI003FCD3333